MKKERFRYLAIVAHGHRDASAFAKRHGIDGDEYFAIGAKATAEYLRGAGSYDFVFVDGVSWADLSDDTRAGLKANGTEVVLQMRLSRRFSLARRAAWSWIKQVVSGSMASKRVPLVAWFDE
jgi:hypothetical protein